MPKDEPEMNCFSGRGIRAPALALLAMICIAACSAAASEAGAAEPSSDLIYDIEFVVTPIRNRHGAWVEMNLRQRDRLLLEFNMHAPAERISDIEGAGEIEIKDGRLHWTPPESGGQLRWFAMIHNRRGQTYDAFIDRNWALFRAEDVIPAARTRTLKGANSSTSIRFVLPDDWTSVTQYAGDNDTYLVANPERRFDRPTGWILLGKLGVRTEVIAGIRIKIAAPINHGARRMDMLALLQWNLPEIIRVLPTFPDRLTIVSAAEPMWRGALSAPMSVYIHADRPLLSENATSTLLHETVHVGLGKRATDGADWIVEGLAEYYSLQALRRSGTISEKRFTAALNMQKDWSKEATSLCNGSSSGANTAFAVTLLARSDGPITMENMQQAVSDLLGSIPAYLAISNLPGCSPA